MSGVEAALRQRIFESLDEHMRRGNGTMTASELASFPVDGSPTRLIANSKGIWNPRQMDATLSVVSSADGPYQDVEFAPGMWRYDYQARSEQGDNTKLRRAYESRTPIILLRKISVGVYVPHFPVFVTEDNRAEHYFALTLPEVMHLSTTVDADTRAYVERTVRQRVHQKEFRGRVLVAYQDRCAVCRLNHAELLDAAHILSDRHERGLPVVTNGISLCKIHHSAYDTDLMGIDPDYRVHINADLLEERDGPMLKHGLQDMHGTSLTLPRTRANRPDRDGIAERFAQFQKAS